MALKGYQQDAISQIVQIASDLVDMQDRVNRFNEVVANAGLIAATDLEIQEFVTFEHLTKAELTAALAAANACAATIEAQRTTLIKMVTK